MQHKQNGPFAKVLLGVGGRSLTYNSCIRQRLP